MGARISEAGIGAFVALILAVALVGIVYLARRKGHLRGRGALLAVTALIALLILYGFSGGLLALI